MPPRKSNVSATSVGEDGQGGGGTPSKERDGINIEDLSLPRTMVQRLAKGVLPPNTALGKDAILAMQKSATVFINYLAAQANATTHASNRKTIPPTAIFEALKDLEFEAFIPRVQAELDRFTEIQASKRNDYRKKVRETKEGVAQKGRSEAGRGEAGEGKEREAKRVRISEGGDEAGVMMAGPESPSAQLREPPVPASEREWNPDEDPEDEEDEGGVAVGESGRGAEEEDGEETDDADEFPDEGHRAESLDMDDPDEEDERERRRRFAYGPGGEGGDVEASSGSEGDDMDED